MSTVQAGGHNHQGSAVHVKRHEGWSQWEVSIQHGMWTYRSVTAKEQRGDLYVSFLPSELFGPAAVLALYHPKASVGTGDECWRFRWTISTADLAQRIGWEEERAAVMADLVKQIVSGEAKIMGFA